MSVASDPVTAVTVEPADGTAFAAGRHAVRWGVTIAATAVSTWLLDLVAAAAGFVLVASGLLDGAPRVLTLGCLVASYAFWAIGMRVNLVANWQLLETTGTSTNALSKVAFELARVRATHPSTVRTASAIGYVLMEIAKEAPYYAGAFAAAAVSDAVDRTEALVFLAGANVGAAGYEYALAQVTRRWLGRRTRFGRHTAEPADDDIDYASFDADWEPRQYLRDYYAFVEPDERATIAFFVEALGLADPDEPILLFGVGPTLHHVFPTAVRASEIHLADYLSTNLDEIERWVAGATDAHDWRPFIDYTLRCEGLDAPTPGDVDARAALTRSKITALLEGDARSPRPLAGRGGAPYGTVISAYCADSATADLATWQTYLSHIAGLVRPGGLFITAALRHSTGYAVGDKTFPSAHVDEADLREALRAGFDVDNGVIEVCDIPAHRSQGYTSIILARLHRRPAPVDDVVRQPAVAGSRPA